MEFFTREGYAERVVVLPGVTSALSAPLFARIPPTQRGVADQVLICTGTGRRGKPCVPPEYVSTRTVIFLMALHRISGLVADLTSHDSDDARVLDADGRIVKERKLWPKETPCAVIERASCPDQRVIRTTLEFVAMAVEEEGSRPPGLLVLGNACEVLVGKEKGRKWSVEEGFVGWEDWIGGGIGDGMGLEELVLNDQMDGKAGKEGDKD